MCGALIGITAVILGGCRIAAPTESDDARRENAALRERVARLEAQNAELEAKLTARAGSAEAAAIAAATPSVAGIEIDKLSGFTRDGAAETGGRLLVYVKPFDGRRRFTQAVGTVVAEARGVDGAVIASRTLNVSELREAYRSQFSGTYYVVEIDVPSRQSSVVAGVRAQLVDLLTGARHEAARDFVIAARSN